ncbi:beta-glucuronidase [Bacillus sp. J14TS2]|uniref:glycoside hydrolase family 2 protein n=1 Tax=Bacillus sp. J14TS2 TaxID=2807188 RepID=UPI001B2BA430|nr:glycoside hydrolase family 2 TIM barrel-domain containing protein [Bacillus sp. J14TS2]GIN69560.1 beta-glucuronidase [Bacillus sp. J14TS2]
MKVIKKYIVLFTFALMFLFFNVIPSVQASNSNDTSKEPMNTEIRNIDGTKVLFQYGKPVPSFDNWNKEENNRKKKSLNGNWKFSYDPKNQGLEKGWHTPGFDDKNWEGKKVPSSWDLYDAPSFDSYDGEKYGLGSAFYDGYAWYRATFHAGADWKNKFIKMNLLGVNYKAEIFFNGHFIAAHEGGHTPFSVDLGHFIKTGNENTIAIRVYRRPWYDSYTAKKQNPITDDKELPYKPVDFWPYAGITRDVYIEVTSPVTVSKVITEAKHHTLQVSSVIFNNSNRKVTKKVITTPGKKTGGKATISNVQLKANEVRVVKHTIDIPLAKAWDVHNPHLYMATVKISDINGKTEDQLTASFGMRTIEVKGGKLLLNGKQAFLKGLNWHEETARSGRSLSVKEYNKELNMVLDTGANFIRNSVYNRHPYVYEFADKYGLLVMDDIDNMWLDIKQQEYQTKTYGLSKALASTMAWNQINNPSVILWGLQNESETSSATVYREWIGDMKAAIKDLDPQDRPVTWASSTSWDPAFDLADVIGFNEYFGYFYGEDSDLGSTLDQVHEQYPSKPILITENGTWSIYGNHGSPLIQGTEEWQVKKFESHWEQVVNRSEYMAGYTFWVLKDYKQRVDYNHNYNGISAMGLMTFGRQEKKQVYYAFKNAVNPFK